MLRVFSTILAGFQTPLWAWIELIFFFTQQWKLSRPPRIYTFYRTAGCWIALEAYNVIGARLRLVREEFDSLLALVES